MSVIIAILLWLGAITPGNYTQTQFDSIQAAHQGQINAVQGDPVTMTVVTSTEDPSVVTVGTILEGE